MFSKLIRRTHMYLALFLAPWMLAYALSTIVMSHALTAPATFSLERTRQYDASFPAGTPPRAIAEQILQDVNLEGAFGVQGPNPAGVITINRQDLLAPRRITYDPAAGRLRIERAEFRVSTFLNRFHHRRGYQQPFAADTLFAASVDAVIVGMVFWALSGLWMWWEMRATRFWGAACALAGAGLFAVFLATI
jgi:hypothetical protein